MAGRRSHPQPPHLPPQPHRAPLPSQYYHYHATSSASSSGRTARGSHSKSRRAPSSSRSSARSHHRPSQNPRHPNYQPQSAFMPTINPLLNFRCTFSGTIADAMKRRGWTQCWSPWSIFFCDMSQFRDLYNSPEMARLMDHQRVGHFRNCQEITRKNLLVKNIKRFRQRLEKSFGKQVSEKIDFMPETFVLPSDHIRFLSAFRPGTHWILKPAAGAQGRGIFIFKTLEEYMSWRSIEMQQMQPQQGPSTSSSHNPDSPELLSPRTATAAPQSSGMGGTGLVRDTFVVQRYIENPYLIGGRKFDIRFFILVTSFVPLRCWMYREGFARFSSGQFSLNALQDVYIHLTNVAIQKTSEDYNPQKGSKWSLQSLREYLTARHGRIATQKLYNEIDYIVIRTLQSAVGLVVNDPHCFEVYGFDVIIDSKLKPWLLEVNASPAFTPSNEEDYKLKVALVDDTVTVLDIEGRLTGMEKRIGGYDLIFDEGPVYANPSHCGNSSGYDGGQKLNSFLGCKNSRVPQLRDLYKSAHLIRTTSSLLTGEEFSEKNLPKMKKNQKDSRFLLPE